MSGTFLGNVELFGLPFELVLLDVDQIKDFFTKEVKHHIAEGTQVNNTMYLSYDNDTFTLMDIIGLTHNGEIVSFCLRPKYSKQVLSRIYTTPKYRGSGLATYLIQWCETSSLSCLKENKVAMALYKRLGFVVVNDFSELVNLERKK